MNKLNHLFTVHFDDFAEFDITITKFPKDLTRDLQRDWRLTPAGTDLIMFCEKYYPKWWKILVKKL